MLSTQFLLTALVVVLAPGTGVVYTLAVALGQGRRAGLWAALGCTFGIVPAMLAAMFGLAALMHSSALLFQAVKVAGVAYLLYLAWQMLHEGGALGYKKTQRPRRDWLSPSAARC
ncbi:Homoserine/homoserine lactone efflux protein [Roseibaca ekhonensis]|jgi:threonine/homoserine/homoserine lactone efflux protein|uniref:Homoserine/homoserine lactone efflux protein n=1 Tax=Roseinatronobacter ekhonensis TaxID=254356 RepID=A0A3B0MBB6_9RHOB|nr:Homoserine/homoserine lactone efflux protein [Roseibaca ekhonensis]